MWPVDVKKVAEKIRKKPLSKVIKTFIIK